MNHETLIVGIDLGKNWFHLVGVDARGTPVLRKKLNRAQLMQFTATAPRCVVAMEACPGSQYWGRKFSAREHEIRIIPAQFVKPYVKSNKNDFNDAAAIAEAASRGTMRFVPLKSAEQVELQATHRVRERFVSERTAVVNQMRALLLEHGIAVPVGRTKFERLIPNILQTADVDLSPRLRLLLERLRNRWRALDVEIEEVTALLRSAANESELCRRVSTVPGVGPIVSTAIVASVGNARAFRKARDMAAWLGLVPRQYSTGGKAQLGGISKRGDAYLRKMLVQGAQVLMLHMKREGSRLGEWIRDTESRCHHNVTVVALANKLSRICWKVLSSGEDYRPRPALQN